MIAVRTVRVVQVSVDEKIDVIAVGYRLMTAARRVHVPLGMTIADVRRRTG